MKKNNLKMDEMGYFTIHVMYEKNNIEVRFHDYSGNVLKTMTGKDAKKLYTKIIEEKLISDLNHAAYLGRELEKAYIALQNKLVYVQDEPLNLKKKRRGKAEEDEEESVEAFQAEES